KAAGCSPGRRLCCLWTAPQVTKLITPELDLAFIWSRRCRADSKLFALLLRTLVTVSNFTLLIALVPGNPFQRGLHTRLAPATSQRRGLFLFRPGAAIAIPEIAALAQP